MHTLQMQARMMSVITIASLILSISMPIFVNAQAVDGTAGNPNPDTAQQAPSTDGQNGDPNQSGQSGTGGLNGGEQAPTLNNDGSNGTGSGGTTTVNTGDATSGTNGTNTQNTNTVNTNEPDWSHPESLTGWAKWKYEMCKRYPEGHHKRPRNCPVIQTTITATNDANIDAAATSTAATGDNAVTAGEGTAVINTGNAYAFGNAINVANSNIVNSDGMLLFLNLLFGQSIDMRSLDLSYFFGDGGSSTGCSLTSCGGDLTVNTDNTAVVSNSLVVRAMTGANDAVGDAGAYINTGNAYAAGNAVNLVNTNMIDSNYLLVTMNSFGGLADDIVLPGADFFTKLLAMQGGSQGGNLNVNGVNTAVVTDNTNATADSGANTSGTTEGNAVVNSGNAISASTAYNQVNTNLVGGTQIFMLFRVWGDWSGSIQGLPDGMQWEQTPFGIVLRNKDGTPASTNALKGACELNCNSGDLNVNATNTATVANNVNVFALTNDNKAFSASGTAAIDTGNAYAAANSVNMVNTNLIGQNWVFMIFNIFGNFSGNISFGHPDLWIGASAETTNPTFPGSDVVYHFTVANHGDSDATNVRIKAKYPVGLMRFDSAFNVADGSLFNIGTIKKGETRELIYRARAGNVPDGVSASVPLEATVMAAETDNNVKDNTEHLDLVVQSGSSIVSKGVTAGGYEPKITMTKTATADATSTPAKVDYKIVVRNDGGDAFNTFLTDSLVAPDGRFIGDQQWDLGKIKGGEEITITYTIAYGKNIKPGIYKNTAVLHGMKNLVYRMDDVSTTHEITISEGQVLGVSTAEAPKSCTPYITGFIKPYGSNDPADVLKLQKFLVSHEEETALTENGTFDSMTREALKRFQIKHADLILTPWGLSQPTGSVYYTTRKVINDLMCNGVSTFSLSDTELNEMKSYKAAPAHTAVAPKPKKVATPAPVSQPAQPAMVSIPSPKPDNGSLKKQIKSLTSWILSKN